MEQVDKAKQFLSEARQELKKVTWPTRQQAVASTWVVLLVTFVLAIFLGLVDLALSKAINLIIR
jgi:preprotein translocase subunit SecE